MRRCFLLLLWTLTACTGSILEDPSLAPPAADGGPLTPYGATSDGGLSDGGASFAATCTAPVSTTAGRLVGERDSTSGTCVWRGIPYAAPPEGARRWQAPQPVTPWSGVRQARTWGPICAQLGIMDGINFDPSGQESEDCLYLNVWRPDKPGSFPVMVWIHGGAYAGGTGNTPLYWGDRLARDGEVVVVTLNYRLGALGFLAQEALRKEDPHQSTGNYGTLDQLAALKWVQDNIAGFGGDPGNVTVFGESAGGWSVCTLLASPLAQGLFHRAILESGACDVSQSLTTCYAQSAAIAKSLGCGAGDAAARLACLRQVPVQKLLTHTGGALRSLDYKNHHDGYVLSQTPLNTIRSGTFNNVPLIAGHNKGEFAWTSSLIPANTATLPAIYDLYLKTIIGGPLGLTDAELTELVSLYPAASFKNKPIDAISTIISEVALSCPTYLGALAVAEQGGQAWFYRFDFDEARVNLLLNWYLPMGAGHGMEIAFVFGNLDRKPASLALGQVAATTFASLSGAMQGHWTAFASGGSPAAQPAWSALDPSAPAALVFDTQVRSQPLDQGAASFHARCQFWDRVGGNSSVLAKLMQQGS